jgi:3-oxoacyl-[acyl-carrier protein] reductase
VLPATRQRGWGRILAIGSSGIVEPLRSLVLSDLARAALRCDGGLIRSP